MTTETATPTPAAAPEPIKRTLLVSQARTDAQVLAQLGELAGVLEATQPRLGVASPRQVATWAHRCAAAWMGWDLEHEMVSPEAYVHAVEEAVGLPVGGHCPAGGHKPEDGTSTESKSAVPPAPEHVADPSNPVPSAPAPMRAAF